MIYKVCGILALANFTYGDNAASDVCRAECSSAVSVQAEQECASWREQLPRPQLFTTCVHGFRHGALNACLDECDGSGTSTGYGAHGNTACEEFRSQRPREIAKACQAGFWSGVKLAEEKASLLLDPALKAKMEAEYRRAEEDQQAEQRKLAEEQQKVAAEQRDLLDKQRKLEAQRAEEAQKLQALEAEQHEEAQRKLKEAAAVDELEQARKEALKAYEEEKANVL